MRSLTCCFTCYSHNTAWVEEEKARGPGRGRKFEEIERDARGFWEKEKVSKKLFEKARRSSEASVLGFATWSSNVLKALKTFRFGKSSRNVFEKVFSASSKTHKTRTQPPLPRVIHTQIKFSVSRRSSISTQSVGAEVEHHWDNIRVANESVLREIIQFERVKATFPALSIMLFSC